jgi:hypothetical protein
MATAKGTDPIHKNLVIDTRRLYDDFHIEMIYNCRDLCCELGIDAAIYYRSDDTTTYDDVKNINSKNLIMVLADRRQKALGASNELQKIKQKFTRVLILVAFEHTNLNFKDITFLHYGGDFLFAQKEWPKIPPQDIKAIIPGNKHWISLSQQPRGHRLFAACYLLGNSLGIDCPEGTGLLRISPYPLNGYDSWKEYAASRLNTWNFDSSFCIDNEKINIGFNSLIELLHGGQPETDIYKNIGYCNNPTNFDLKLRKFYQHALVEIVNETQCADSDIFITEKYQQTIYGYTLPILIASPGSVEYLRNNGFDMFDDVIDHSYDKISDHAQRIMSAIDLNLKLLVDKQHAIKAWNHVKQRMDVNYQYVKHDMYDFFKSKYMTQLEEILKSF